MAIYLFARSVGPVHGQRLRPRWQPKPGSLVCPCGRLDDTAHQLWPGPAPLQPEELFPCVRLAQGPLWLETRCLEWMLTSFRTDLWGTTARPVQRRWGGYSNQGSGLHTQVRRVSSRGCHLWVLWAQASPGAGMFDPLPPGLCGFWVFSVDVLLQNMWDRPQEQGPKCHGSSAFWGCSLPQLNGVPVL